MACSACLPCHTWLAGFLVVGVIRAFAAVRAGRQLTALKLHGAWGSGRWHITLASSLSSVAESVWLAE